MLRRVRLFKDGAGFVLRIMGLELEELERIPPSEGDRLLYARVLGMAYLWGKPAEKPIDDDMPPGLRDVDTLSDEELEARMLNGKGDDA